MKLFGISLITLVAAVAVVALLNRNVMGRRLLATGGAPAA